MFNISINISISRKKREMADVVCSHCGRQYRTHVSNLRATNYCNSCK